MSDEEENEGVNPDDIADEWAAAMEEQDEEAVKK